MLRALYLWSNWIMLQLMVWHTFFFLTSILPVVVGIVIALDFLKPSSCTKLTFTIHRITRRWKACYGTGCLCFCPIWNENSILLSLNSIYPLIATFALTSCSVLDTTLLHIPMPPTCPCSDLYFSRSTIHSISFLLHTL